MADKGGCFAEFKVVLKKLVECQRLNIRDCYSLVLLYSKFLDLATKVETSAFEEFNFKVDRLDLFLKQIGSVRSLSKLWDLLRKLLILSHGQATVERGCSVNRQVMIENMKEQTCIAQRTIHDHIQSIGGLVSYWLAGNFLQQLVQGKKLYPAYLEEQQQASQNRKRKIVLGEKAELEKKNKCLTSDIRALQLDADPLEKEAAEKAKLVLLSKSNALRKAERKGNRPREN